MRQCGKKFRVRHGEELPLINGFEVEVKPEHLDSYLESLPKDSSHMFNEPLRFSPPARESDADATSPDETPHLSRPQGLDEVWARGVTGEGVTVAVLDSGLHPHADYQDRVKEFLDLHDRRRTRLHDPEGHGTNVTGILAGDGEEVKGVAPGVDLVGIRVTDPKEAIEGLEWVIANKERYGIKVVNMSLGVRPRDPAAQDPWSLATQKAIEAGLVVVVAAGNECRSDDGVCPGTISSPGINPSAITVGALNDAGTPELEDDVMYSRSSQGPTRIDGFAKPDVVAPGVRVFGPLSPGSRLDQRFRPHWQQYLALTGTSQATPMVAGAAALMLSVNPDLTPAQVKEILSQTSDPVEGISEEAQGRGRLDVAEAVARAREA